MSQLTQPEQKNRMLAYLKVKGITDIVELWGHAKEWARLNNYEMGGGYASFGTDISVHLVKEKTTERFKISLAEVNNGAAKKL